MDASSNWTAIAECHKVAPVELDKIERAAIELALEQCGGRVYRAAAMLGVGPSTLYRKLERYGVKAE